MQSKKSTPWFLFFLLLLFYACKNDEPVSSQEEEVIVGSALSFFEKAHEVEGAREKIEQINKGLLVVRNKRDTLLPHLLDYKVKNHNRLKEYDSSLYFADSLINIAQFQKDTASLAKGFYRKSRINEYLKNQEEVYIYNFEASRLFLAIKDSSQAGRRTLEMAIAQNRLGDFTGSQETATEALKLLDVKTDSVYLCSAYNEIALVYHKQKLYEDAVSEYKNALRFSSSTKDSLSILNNLALVFKDKKNYPDAILIWKDVLEKTESDVKKARFLDNLTFTKWLQDPSFPAEKDFFVALQMRNEIPNREGLLGSFDHLSQFYENTDVGLSTRYSEELLALAQELQNTDAEFIALKRLIPTSALSQARIYSGRYIQLIDSVQEAALKAKNTFAKIRFDKERKQQEIVGLEAQNTIQAMETRQLRTRSWIGILAGTLVILGLFFLIYYFRQRQKKHEIREVHKTESRISKVIHDELANDIFNIMSSLEPVAPIPVIDKLEKIYLRTRDISRENREIDTGEDYVDYLKAILSNNTPDDSKLIVSGENSVNWDKLKEEKKIVIYRVLQELMINMKKHSGAKLVAISFVVKNKNLNIRYSDTGCGTLWNPSKKGSGLQNVENRISSLNGKIIFESEKGYGFKIDMKIPV